MAVSSSHRLTSLNRYIWKKDEAKKKEQKIEEDRKKKLKDELKKIKEEHIHNVEFRGPSYCPDNSELTNSLTYVKCASTAEEEAYNKAIEFILEDLEYHICDIIRSEDEMYHQSCRLECFTAPRNIPVTFSQKEKENHVLFMFRHCFKQRNVLER